MADVIYNDIFEEGDPRQQPEWRGTADPDLTMRELLERATAKVNNREGMDGRTESLVR